MSRLAGVFCQLYHNQKSLIMERITYNEVPEELLKPMRQLQAAIDNSGLDKKLLSLIRMRVSQINSCAYCIDMHFKEGIQAGESAQRLISVSAWRETSYYSPEERSVLAFAEILTRMSEEQYSNDIHDEISLHFSKNEIAKLTFAVLQINSWNRLVRSFGNVAGSYKAAVEHN